MTRTRATTGATDVDALLDRVRRLEEIEIARNLLHTYAATMDDPTPEKVSALFTTDGVLRTKLGEFTGREAIAAFFAQRIDTDTETRHFIANPRTRWLEPGRVEVASYFLFTGRMAGSSAVGWGTYLDVIAVDGDTALFADKSIQVEVRTDLAAGWAAVPATVT